MIRIHEDLAIPYAGNPWRIFVLKAHGCTVGELLESALIHEMALNGVEYRSYALRDAANEVRDRALAVIGDTFSDHVYRVQRLRNLEVGA